jgi:DNA helicase HerA-like ATPase
LVILEVDIYCPERGSGEAESTEAVISLMSQGRKRGFSGIIATQRLSKLHKDAAAEANNVIIGRTWLDAD